MERRSRLAVLAAVGAPLLLIAPALRTRAAVPVTRPHATIQVAIQNFAFSPQTLTVAPGTTVVWTNKDTAPHTVTSDRGAWTDSGTLSTGKTFSLTMTKPGTYAYHCAVHPNMVATLTVSQSATPATGGAGSPGMSMMGPMGTTKMTSFTGYYDDHTVRYLSTDTSNKDEAMRDHINYAPVLAKSLAQTSDIYFVTNAAFAGHGAVFGSQPGAGDYTPLWQEVRVTWKNPAQAVALGSDNQINDLAKKGKVTLKMTGIVLNCPIIAVMSHGM